MNTSSIALAALAALAFSSGAQAFQGEQSPLPPAPFESTLSRAQVQQQAMHPVHISNGGTGVLSRRTGAVQRSDVRAGAIRIASEGVAAYGDTYQ